MFLQVGIGDTVTFGWCVKEGAEWTAEVEAVEDAEKIRVDFRRSRPSVPPKFRPDGRGAVCSQSKSPNLPPLAPDSPLGPKVIPEAPLKLLRYYEVLQSPAHHLSTPYEVLGGP